MTQQQKQTSIQKARAFNRDLVTPICTKRFHATIAHLAMNPDAAAVARQQNDSESFRVLMEKLRRLELLTDHLALPRNDGDKSADFRMLSLVLAEKIYPGFRTELDHSEHIVPRRAAQVTTFLIDVENLKLKFELSDSEAIAQLLSERGDSRRYSSTDADPKTTFPNWLAEARSPEKNMFHCLYALAQGKGPKAIDRLSSILRKFFTMPNQIVDRE